MDSEQETTKITASVHSKLQIKINEITQNNQASAYSFLNLQALGVFLKLK